MIYGITKGTDFEKLCDGAAKAEAAGVMMYYALARMAFGAIYIRYGI